jgi:hypothetical protein
MSFHTAMNDHRTLPYHRPSCGSFLDPPLSGNKRGNAWYGGWQGTQAPLLQLCPEPLWQVSAYAVPGCVSLWDSAWLQCQMRTPYGHRPVIIFPMSTNIYPPPFCYEALETEIQGRSAEPRLWDKTESRAEEACKGWLSRSGGDFP